jgi:hypothetical protein
MPRMPAAVRYLTLHRLAFSITALTVLLTAVSAAAVAAFASSTVTVANRETLADNASSAILVTAGTTDFAATSSVVTRTLSGAAAGLPMSFITARKSDPLDLPSGLGGAKAQAVLESMAGFRQHAILVSGHWPAATPQPGRQVQACLPLAAAKLLRVGAGSRLSVRDSLGGPSAQVLVACTFSERDAGAPYWQLDPLGTSATSSLGGFTNYGPLITTEPSASWPVAATSGSWLAVPDFGAMTATNLSALSASVGNAVSGLANNQSVSFGVSTSLPALLSDQAVALEVARSQLLIGELILLVVAGATLAVAVHLLASQRGGQPALLKARGATRRQLAGRGATDALLLAVPAAIGGPLIGAWLAPVMARLGVAGSAPIRFPVALPLSAWIAGIAVAAGCAFVIALPWLRDPPSPVSQRAGRARQRSVTVALAGGADLALVLLAAGAAWELAHYTAPIATGLDGSIGIDPILVIAPVLALTAGTLVMLRLLPWLVRFAERLASRGRGIIVPAAAWLISRRALRQAGPALLTVLAVATAVITIGEAASWQHSVSDQARFAVGADTRVVLPAAAPLPMDAVSDVTGAHGVQAATPVVRASFTVASNAPAQLLAVNSAMAAAVVPLRSDLDIVPARDPLSVLGQPRPVGVTLPGRPASLQLVLSLSAPQNSGTGEVLGCFQSSCDTSTGAQATLAGITNASLAVMLTDGAGVQYAAATVALATNGTSQRVRITLGPGTDYPVTLSGFGLSYQLPENDPGQVATLAIRSASVAASATAPWTTLPAVLAPQHSEVSLAGLARRRILRLEVSGQTATASTEPFTSYGPHLTSGPARIMSLTTAGHGAVLRFHAGAGSAFQSYGNQGAFASLTVAGQRASYLPGIATRAYLTATGAHLGSVVQVGGLATALPVKLVGEVAQFPTVQDSGGAVIVDQSALQDYLQATGNAPVPVTEWWLRDTGQPRFSGLPAGSTVTSTRQVAAGLRSQPLGVAPLDALIAVAAVALLLALAGFMVSVAASAERARDLAVLDALGATPGQLTRLRCLEQAMLSAPAAAGGLALGLLLSRLIIPAVTITAQATQPIPSVLVLIPLLPSVGIAVAIAAVPVAAVALSMLAGTATVARLRAEEEV